MQYTLHAKWFFWPFHGHTIKNVKITLSYVIGYHVLLIQGVIDLLVARVA